MNFLKRRVRGPKGLYIKALDNELQKFTGISAPYEAPMASDIVLDIFNSEMS